MGDPHPLTVDERTRERDERLLKVAQAAILLNYSDRQVQRLYASGQLAYVRMQNGAIRIPLAAVNAFKAHHQGLVDDAAEVESADVRADEAVPQRRPRSG